GAVIEGEAALRGVPPDVDHPTLLALDAHLLDVQEVRVELEQQLGLRWRHAVVDDADPLLHARADAAEDGELERVLREQRPRRRAAGARHAQVGVPAVALERAGRVEDWLAAVE